LVPPYPGEGTVPPTPEGNKDGYFTFPRLLLSVPLSTCGKHNALAPGDQPCCAPCPRTQWGGSARLLPSAPCLSPLQTPAPSRMNGEIAGPSQMSLTPRQTRRDADSLQEKPRQALQELRLVKQQYYVSFHVLGEFLT